MKHFILFLLIQTSFLVGFAEGKKENPGKTAKTYQFENEYVLPVTPVKDQFSTNTCWSFAALSFFESEMLRQGKPEVDLSEMFIVWHTYIEKAIKQVRLHGLAKYGPGGAFHDVVNMISKYGIVPESVYSGLTSESDEHNHYDLENSLKKILEPITDEQNEKLDTNWLRNIRISLNTHLGWLPNTFIFDHTLYTPVSFAKDYVGLNLSDYIEITSYTHHPFYSRFKLEIPDNWSWDETYNVPIDELEEIIDYSLQNRFTVAWAADISEDGFLDDKGIAILPPIPEAKTGNKNKFDSDSIVNEPVISQELRQRTFDDYETTDDHGMHIVGIAHNSDGKVFYKVKNSWGNYNRYNGFFYASKPYIKLKTISVMVNKNGIPEHIRKKLGL